MANVGITSKGLILGGICTVFGAGAVTLYNMAPEIPEPTVITQEDGTEKVLPSGPEIQETASIWKDVDGRDYLIWEGHVVEESDNSMEHNGRINISYDADIYNFDLGIIIHGGYGEGASDAGGALTRTLFNELADKDGNLPPHIEKVKQIGCEIAEEYFERESSQEYTETPADVRAYYSRHCSID